MGALSNISEQDRLQQEFRQCCAVALKSDKGDQKSAQKVGGLQSMCLRSNLLPPQEQTASPKRSCYEVFHAIPDDERRLAQAFEHPSLHLGPQVATPLITDDDEITVSSMPSLWSPHDDSDYSNDDSLDDEDASDPLPHDTALEAVPDFTPPVQSSVQASRYMVRQVVADVQSMQYYMSSYSRLTIFDDTGAHHSLFLPPNASVSPAELYAAFDDDPHSEMQHPPISLSPSDAKPSVCSIVPNKSLLPAFANVTDSTSAP
jgi:hypothetical protein